MLLTLLFYFYITFLSWAYGSFFLRQLNYSFDFKPASGIDLSVTYLLGFVIITSFASLLSLIINLDSLWVHLSILLPAFFFLIKNKGTFKHSFTLFNTLAPPVKLVTAASILLILVMSVWKIAHPDTLGYHQQIIQSIEEDGIVQAFATENIRYGLQSNWFVACALFSFKFLGLPALTFINVTLLIWTVLFIAERFNHHYTGTSSQNNWNLLAWIALLTIIFWDYTQIRLTATSASPDFIVAIFIWYIFYLYINCKKSYSLYFSLFVFCIFVITIKLSAYPIALLALILLISLIRLRPKKLLLLAGIALFTTVPFLIRNVYTSGYILFPSPTPDLFDVEWKLNKQQLTETNDYIKAYARTKSSSEVEQVQVVINSSFLKWGPIWWHNQSYAQKSLHISLIILSASALTFVFRKKNKISYFNKKEFTTLLICFYGIISWWILAPDLRFGYAFYIPAIAILSNAIILRRFSITLNWKVIKAFTYMLSTILFMYIIYRLIYYFELENLLYPFGII